ncbi:hypothetical protein, partial [Bacillus toyonensis]
LYGFALYYFYKNHIEKLQEPRKKSKSAKGTGGVKVATIAAGSGQLIANIILSIATQQMGAIVFMSACTVISFVLFYMIIELHKYYYLRKHIEDGGKIRIGF